MGSARSINIANGMPLRKRKHMPMLRSRTPSSFQINSVNRSPMGVNRYGNKSYQNLLGASLDQSDEEPANRLAADQLGTDESAGRRNTLEQVQRFQKVHTLLYNSITEILIFVS